MSECGGARGYFWTDKILLTVVDGIDGLVDSREAQVS